MITTSSTFASSLAATSFAPLINIINGNAHLILGFGLAYSINKLAHHIFGVNKDSNASTVIRTVAFITGSCVSLSFAPQAAIFSLSFINATLMAIGIVFFNRVQIHVADQCISRKMPGVYQPDHQFENIISGLTATLPFVGLFGHVGLVALGSSGAAVGAIL